MHRVEGAHSKAAQAQTGHVVGHARHSAGLQAAVHVGVGAEALCEGGGVGHGSVSGSDKPGNMKC